MFWRDNRIWRKGLICKSSSIASNQVIQQTRWYNKRILIKGYSVPSDFSRIENYKLFWADSSKSTLVNVFRQRENPILRNIPCAQYEESKSMSLTTFGYFLISALAEALAMDQVITAPRLLISSMYFWTIESNCPKSKDRPVFERYLSIDVCGCLVWKFCRATCKPNQKKKKEYIHTYWRFLLFISWSRFSYLFWNSRTVLS